ncbi:protein of unknown function [Candidatus Nitrosacidococcus tergens]|uniref:Uncharacterized protein n=1 Tax=Candidatus Nitrosacidococcus tergens TaxID=553981 RepID=A0A7G1QB61_9GAMM|nr:protein of unknown function [Candidatus Nitrosacidococcus tergens]
MTSPHVSTQLDYSFINSKEFSRNQQIFLSLNTLLMEKN